MVPVDRSRHLRSKPLSLPHKKEKKRTNCQARRCFEIDCFHENVWLRKFLNQVVELQHSSFLSNRYQQYDSDSELIQESESSQLQSIVSQSHIMLHTLPPDSAHATSEWPGRPGCPRWRTHELWTPVITWRTGGRNLSTRLHPTTQTKDNENGYHWNN